MKDVEDLLRRVLAERADDVPPDPGLADRVRARAGRGQPIRVLRWGTAGAVAAAAVIAVVLLVQGVTAASRQPGPAGEVRPSDSTSLPSGTVPLTPGTWSATPLHPGGCGMFSRGVPSMPQDPPASTSYHRPWPSTGGSPPAQASAVSSAVEASAAPSERWGPAGLAQAVGWEGVSPAMEAVHWDLDKVLDGRRFGGFEKDDTGRSITVYVVRGPDAAEAESIAHGCARPDVPINIRYVDRGYDQLRGLGASLSRTLPAEVKPLLRPDHSGFDVTGGYEWGIDVRRNRLCLFATAPPTPAMRQALVARYGDAVELWMQATHTLIAPDRSWTTG